MTSTRVRTLATERKNGRARRRSNVAAYIGFTYSNERHVMRPRPPLWGRQASTIPAKIVSRKMAGDGNRNEHWARKMTLEHNERWAVRCTSTTYNKIRIIVVNESTWLRIIKQYKLDDALLIFGFNVVGSVSLPLVRQTCREWAAWNEKTTGRERENDIAIARPHCSFLLVWIWSLRLTQSVAWWVDTPWPANIFLFTDWARIWLSKRNRIRRRRYEGSICFM